MARVEEKVSLLAEATKDTQPGTAATFKIWEKEKAGTGAPLATLSSQVKGGGKIEAKWSYRYRPDCDGVPVPGKKLEAGSGKKPEYVF